MGSHAARSRARGPGVGGARRRALHRPHLHSSHHLAASKGRARRRTLPPRAAARARAHPPRAPRAPQVFKRVPSTDASLILASEPLWATLVALWLLGGHVTVSEAVGGTLILGALACNQGLIDQALPESWRGEEAVTK